MSVMKLTSIKNADFNNKSFESVSDWLLNGLSNYSAVRAYDGSKSMLITDSGSLFSSSNFFFLRLATTAGATIAEFGISDDWSVDDTGWQTITIDISAYAGLTGYILWGLKDSFYPAIPESFLTPIGIIFGNSVTFYYWREVSGGKKVYVDLVSGGKLAEDVAISFDPAQPYNKPDDINTIHTRAKDGTLYSYLLSYKRRWSVPCKWFSSTDASSLNTWWQNNNNLLFYPDLINSPSVYYPVRITNQERPLLDTADYTFENLFEGTLQLQEL